MKNVPTTEEIKQRLAADFAFRMQIASAMIICAPDPFEMLDILRPQITFADVKNGQMPPFFARLAMFAARERAVRPGTPIQPPSPTQAPSTALN